MRVPAAIAPPVVVGFTPVRTGRVPAEVEAGPSEDHRSGPVPVIVPSPTVAPAWVVGAPAVVPVPIVVAIVQMTPVETVVVVEVGAGTMEVAVVGESDPDPESEPESEPESPTGVAGIAERHPGQPQAQAVSVFGGVGSRQTESEGNTFEHLGASGRRHGQRRCSSKNRSRFLHGRSPEAVSTCGILDASTVPWVLGRGNCQPCKRLAGGNPSEGTPAVRKLPQSDVAARGRMVRRTCVTEATRQRERRGLPSRGASPRTVPAPPVPLRPDLVLSCGEDGHREGSGKGQTGGAGGTVPLRIGPWLPILIGTAPSRFQAAVADGDVSSNFAGPVIVAGARRGFARSDSQGWRLRVRTRAPLVPSVTETLPAPREAGRTSSKV